MSIKVVVTYICDGCGHKREGKDEGGVGVMDRWGLWDILKDSDTEGMISDAELGNSVFCSDKCWEKAREKSGLPKKTGVWMA